MNIPRFKCLKLSTPSDIVILYWNNAKAIFVTLTLPREVLSDISFALDVCGVLVNSNSINIGVLRKD